MSISPLDEAPVTICSTCYQFLLSVARFSERIAKVEAMYASIAYDEVNSVDYSSLKFQFGLVKEEPHSNFVSSKCDQSTDTTDLTIEFLPTEVYKIEEQPLGESTLQYQNVDDAVIEEVEEKIDPLVQQLFTMDQLDNVDKESIPDLCTDYLEDEEDDEDEIEEKAEEEDAQKSKRDSGESPKKKGRKRKEPPFQCNKCDKAFLQRNALRYHKRVSHFTGEKKEFQCQRCDKKFPTRRRAEQHEIVHLEPDQKPAFPCPHCDKHFTKTTNLQTHIRTIHVGERPFICESCGKSFATKGALKEHNYTHMDETPFQCSACPKKFKTLARLKTHEDIHTGTMYVCPNCGLILNTKRTLQMHMVVHSDQKKHKCTICNSEFKRAKALKNHLILHSGLRPYTCPFCDKTFANGSNCRSHKKKAHPQELAAMEAAGETCRATNIPKLEQLKAS